MRLSAQESLSRTKLKIKKIKLRSKFSCLPWTQHEANQGRAISRLSLLIRRSAIALTAARDPAKTLSKKQNTTLRIISRPYPVNAFRKGCLKPNPQPHQLRSGKNRQIRAERHTEPPGVSLGATCRFRVSRSAHLETHPLGVIPHPWNRRFKPKVPGAERNLGNNQFHLGVNASPQAHDKK